MRLSDQRYSPTKQLDGSLRYSNVSKDSTARHDLEKEHEQVGSGSSSGVKGDTSNDEERESSGVEGDASNDEERESSGVKEGAGNNEESGKEEAQGGPPTPVGFWHPSLRHVRKEAFGKWVLTTGILMAFIIACLSMYWAVFFDLPAKLKNLKVFVVDFDGQTAPYNTSGVAPLLGPMITQLAKTMGAQPNMLGYTFPEASEFGYDPIAVRQAIYDWEAWAAIIINPNATTLLRNAVENGNTSYSPTGACQVIYQSARDETNWFNYLLPMLSTFMTEATSKFSEQWAGQVLQNATTNATLRENIARVPQAVSPAIGFSQYDLRPFYPPTATPGVTIGLIYLIIVSFFSFAFYLPIHMKYLKPEGHPPLKFWQLVIWRWLATISAYFMLSLAYSLISLAFQINFSGVDYHLSQTNVVPVGDGHLNPDAYGKGTFPVYWMINFFGMIALGLACENVAMLVGQPWTACWLIFWVITNVSTSFYDIEVTPVFFRWGYAWPLHYVVQGSRQVLFDLKSHIGLDFGVLIAWGAVNTAFFPFCCYFMRWKSKHHVNEYYR